jgi:RecA/RadA recombinase
MSDLVTRMRDRLNSKKDKPDYAKSFTSKEELLQIKSWIPLKPFFKLATGGEGFPCGHITQIIGETDSGKTTLMMEGMVSCQELGGVVYLIDSEHKFSMSRFALMGGKPESVIVIQVDSLEQAWDAIKDVCEVIKEERDSGYNGPVMVCWDSIAASVPQRISDEEEAGDAHVAVEAKINNKNIRKLRAFIKSTEVACVFINHFYTTMPAPGKPPKDIIKGGEEITFMTTLVIKTKKGAKIERGVKGETQQIGRVTKFQTFKGHFHGRNIEKDVYVVDKGILETKEELDDYKKTLRGEF